MQRMSDIPERIDDTSSSVQVIYMHLHVGASQNEDGAEGNPKNT